MRASLSPEQRIAFDEVAAVESRWLTRVGGQEHARLRAVVQRAFTPRRIAELELATRTYLGEMLAEIAGSGGDIDLMPFAYRLPLMIIGDLLGVPGAERELIHGWSRRIARNLGSYKLDLMLDAHAAYREFTAYIEDAILQRRGVEPESDLLAALVGAEQEQRLTPAEIVSMFIVLLFAGHETTTNLIGTGLAELLRHPRQWSLLTADPGRAPDAVEELLRFVSPIQWNLRQATEPVELRGYQVRAGQDVQIILAAANRDPEVFFRPMELNISRADAARHLAFGFGPHFCLGAALARLEGRIVFETLAARCPDLELAAPQLSWEGTANLRRLSALPVRVGPVGVALP
jgi:cytochrome P450